MCDFRLNIQMLLNLNNIFTQLFLSFFNASDFEVSFLLRLVIPIHFILLLLLITLRERTVSIRAILTTGLGHFIRIRLKLSEKIITKVSGKIRFIVLVSEKQLVLISSLFET